MLRLATLAVLLLGVAPVGAAEPRSMRFADTVSPEAGEALPGLPWGASRKQIEALRGTRLEVADPYFLDHYGPPGVPRQELLELEEKKVSVGGFGGIVSYRMRQGGLYQVLVFVEAGLELAARHEEILKALEASLGAGKPSPKQRDDELHAREWELPGRKARYWMLDDPSKGPKERISVAVETSRASP